MSGNNGTVVETLPDTALYGYIPSRAVAIIFLLLFLASTVIHTVQALKYRMRWLLGTACLCGIIELLGWSGRLWSSFSPLASIPFQIEITCTIVAPTPLLAASFVILGEIIKILGPSYSRLTPKWYTVLFCSSDVIALFVQGAGGGIAATAQDDKGAEKGAHIMLFGIVFQLIIILVYAACAVEFFLRYHMDAPFSARMDIRNDKADRGELTSNVKTMAFALAFSTTCFFIRSIYRIAELADGWTGRIIHTQVYFNVLDGAMIILAIYTLNFFHPGRLLPSQEQGKRLDYINV
ncbi:hypothetical protein GALMADRAFT_222849 [Galerina marginata CBS 339.88]|uniref:RTA1 like protein n=1 Tax=Galerina marginata (strain CBS 339.88) TaxID=685588 RepID=A0A067TJ32_GALM3|nr:hypothetical protein GALMADRAFT_222849 [Galerina marginata CBS 339.88]